MCIFWLLKTKRNWYTRFFVSILRYLLDTWITKLLGGNPNKSTKCVSYFTIAFTSTSPNIRDSLFLVSIYMFVSFARPSTRPLVRIKVHTIIQRLVKVSHLDVFHWWLKSIIKNKAKWPHCRTRYPSATWNFI